MSITSRRPGAVMALAIIAPVLACRGSRRQGAAADADAAPALAVAVDALPPLRCLDGVDFGVLSRAREAVKTTGIPVDADLNSRGDRVAILTVGLPRGEPVTPSPIPDAAGAEAVARAAIARFRRAFGSDAETADLERATMVARPYRFLRRDMWLVDGTRPGASRAEVHVLLDKDHGSTAWIRLDEPPGPCTEGTISVDDPRIHQALLTATAYAGHDGHEVTFTADDIYAIYPSVEQLERKGDLRRVMKVMLRGLAFSAYFDLYSAELLAVHSNLDY